jgi:hypothetical protein
LLADGPSDRALLPIIDWVLSRIPRLEGLGFVEQWADFRSLPGPPRGLPERVERALERYPCEILFIHRDAESRPASERIEEIARAVTQKVSPTWVPIVPVRMTEAWLLVDEGAVRQAADNPNGSVGLELPTVKTLESLPDPKSQLRDMLLIASEKRGRRRRQFERDLPRRIPRIAEIIEDFSPLRKLAAFQRFEDAALEAVDTVLEQRKAHDESN